MSLKEKWKKFKEELAWQKRQSKAILKTKWDMGAEQGKAMKKQQKDKIREVMKK